MSNNTSTIALGDLLTETQLIEIDHLTKRIRAGEDKNILRDYLRTQAEVLEAKGVLADYMFWSLVYHLKLL